MIPFAVGGFFGERLTGVYIGIRDGERSQKDRWCWRFGESHSSEAGDLDLEF